MLGSQRLHANIKRFAQRGFGRLVVAALHRPHCDGIEDAGDVGVVTAENLSLDIQCLPGERNGSHRVALVVHQERKAA